MGDDIKEMALQNMIMKKVGTRKSGVIRHAFLRFPSRIL